MARILVVDDDPLWLSLIRLRLEELGHQVTACREPLEAFGLLRRPDFDVVVLDLRMPLNGKSLLWFSRKYNAQVPVIVYTSFEGSANDPDVAGAAAFVVKRPDMVGLVGEIDKALKRSAGLEAHPA